MKRRIRILRPCQTPNIGEWQEGQIVALTPETGHLLKQGAAELVKENRREREE